jgi:hypothetical protein
MWKSKGFGNFLQNHSKKWQTNICERQNFPFLCMWLYSLTNQKYDVNSIVFLLTHFYIIERIIKKFNNICAHSLVKTDLKNQTLVECQLSALNNIKYE